MKISELVRHLLIVFHRLATQLSASCPIRIRPTLPAQAFNRPQCGGTAETVDRQNDGAVKRSQFDVDVLSKTHQVELTFRNADEVHGRPVTKGAPMLLATLHMPQSKHLLQPLVDLPVPVAPGVTRDDVLANMPRPPDASAEFNGKPRNDRWLFEGFRLVYIYRGGHELKAVQLIGEVPAAGATS